MPRRPFVPISCIRKRERARRGQMHRCINNNNAKTTNSSASTVSNTFVIAIARNITSTSYLTVSVPIETIGTLTIKGLTSSAATIKSASAAGIPHVSTHSMRHTYRSWLDSVGTAITVQQKLMRHADIRTTMNTYGEVVTDEMSQAASKVAGLALNGAQAERKSVKFFVLAEACVSRTHRQHRRCRPPVLKTGTITGPHALP